MTATLPRLATLGLCLALGLAACKQDAAPAAGNAPGAAATADTAPAGDKVAAQITGAGASFVYPLISKWSADYAKATGNKVNYQSIGSGGGIAQIKAGTVDFGSSDKPLAPEELARYITEKGSIAVDGISLTVNGVKGREFRLTIVPHTALETTIAQWKPGTRVNLEVDQIARYLERLMQGRAESGSTLTLEKLAQSGFL